MGICMTTPTTTTRDVLTQAEAEARALRISDCHYTLDLDIPRKAEGYRGTVNIEFTLSGAGDTFVDHRGKSIQLLEINGLAVPADWTGYRLMLPGAALVQGANTVRIVYENDYDHSGDGFHQFIDPEDGEEYLYSNFEPYEAHRLFPCFDQPDIKASYQLTITAPADWEIVTNSRELHADAAAGGRARRSFETTKAFSTYLFALVAGPYEAFREDHNGIPLGLFCRKSMARYLDRDEIFTITRQGLDFYGEFFDLPYPFGKYDQIFVPEFNAGAMENVAAVTHNEFMVFRDPPTDNQRRRRAEVILHEMAHMWFGDLVTMRWWNDLWLNESFATYMSYLCMTSATRFTAGWQDFNAAIKNWAYRQDQLITTHPIAGTVADTDETFLNFDGITYGKGASVLKQLVAAIGMDGFRDGMRHYFRNHAYGNATLAQFLASLEAGSRKDLKEWSRLWLETPSLNTIAASWDADGERVTRLALTQTALPEYPTIRPHHLDVGLVRDEGGEIEIRSLPASLTAREAVVEAAVGAARPSLVFPNYNDHAYAKVALDADSIAWARENIDRLADPLLRQLLWSSLWNMTRDQQLKAQDFLALVNGKILLERDITIAEAVLGYATLVYARFLPESMRPQAAHALFDTAWAGLQAAPRGDSQIVWARTLIGVAETPDDLAVAAQLADGAVTVEGFAVDQEMRWSIATKFVAYGMPGASGRLDAERLADTSDRGERALRRAGTSAPDARTKSDAWERIHGEGYGSLHLTRAAMEGFNWAHQRALLAPYVGRFFEQVPAIFQRDDHQFAQDYFGLLFPRYRVEQDTLDRAERLLADCGADSPVLARMIREANDELGRALKCRAFALS